MLFLAPENFFPSPVVVLQYRKGVLFPPLHIAQCSHLKPHVHHLCTCLWMTNGGCVWCTVSVLNEISSAGRLCRSCRGCSEWTNGSFLQPHLVLPSSAPDSTCFLHQNPSSTAPRPSLVKYITIMGPTCLAFLTNMYPRCTKIMCFCFLLSLLRSLYWSI